MKVKTHLIVTGIKDEYTIKWHEKIINTTPLMKNGLPIFVIIGGTKGRVEINSANMKRIEECAKKLTNPHGRSAVTSDTSRIYIKEVDGKETLVGSVIHYNIKTYAPMYDEVGYRDNN